MAHEHQSSAQVHRASLVVAFSITMAILAAEIVGAILSGSLALAADAAHMSMDAVGIGLSLLAVWFAGRSASEERTYGFYRLEMLAAALNALLLFLVGGYILFESVQRFVEPPDVSSRVMIQFAIVAIAGNAVSMWVLRHGQAASLNVRAAFLEVLSDLLGAGAVLIAAGVIAFTGFQRADALASGLIGIVILPRTWHLLRNAAEVLLEATPAGTNVAEIRQHFLDAEGVLDIHDLHVWSITSGLNVLSAHVVKLPETEASAVLESLRDCATEHFEIEHSTFQLESPEQRSKESAVHS